MFAVCIMRRGERACKLHETSQLFWIVFSCRKEGVARNVTVILDHTKAWIEPLLAPNVTAILDRRQTRHRGILHQT